MFLYFACQNNNCFFTRFPNAWNKIASFHALLTRHYEAHRRVRLGPPAEWFYDAFAVYLFSFGTLFVLGLFSFLKFSKFEDSYLVNCLCSVGL